MFMHVHTLNENKVTNVLSKANNAAYNAYNTYQTFRGKRDSKFDYTQKANKDDLPDTLKLSDEDLKDIKFVGKDSRNGYVKIEFNGMDVSKDLVDRLDPATKDNKDSLFPYVTNYDNHMVTLELPMDGYDHRGMKTKMKDKVQDLAKNGKLPNKIGDKINTNRRKQDIANESLKLNESVAWNYFDKFEDVTAEYLPYEGEGNNKASQMVTAVTKIVYKWYNDGDVYDNTHYLEGWVNDISDFANWLSEYIPKCNIILKGIETAKTEDAYEDILKKLADYCFSEEALSKMAQKDKEGTIYNCPGPFKFNENRNQDDTDDYDGYWDDEEDDEDDYDFYDESLELKEEVIEQLNGTEAYAADRALDMINTGYVDDIEDAVSRACNEADGGSAEPEYEDEPFYMEECDYYKVLRYVQDNLKIKSEDESVMVPTPTPYKSKNRAKKDEDLTEGLELNLESVDEDEEDTSSDKFSYRVTYKDNDTADYEEKIVIAKDAEEAIQNFKEEMPGKFIAQVASDSFTDPQVYYQDGWSEVREEGALKEDFDYGEDDDLDEELELKESRSYDTVAKLDDWLTGAFFDYMINQGGFENDKEVDLYLNPHIDITKEDDGRTKVQFRYEAPDYDSQIDVANELSKIVEKYDKDAYFDLYSYGVLEAWIDYPFVYEYSESLELKVDEDEVLTETPGLTLSEPEVNYTSGRDSEGISLSIEINGKTYKYVMKHEAGEEGKTPADVARTVKKMQKFSDGKALAYLKKNMIAVEDESLGESHKVHIDYGFQERTLDYPDKETAQKKVDQVNELRKQPYLRGLKVWMDEDNPLDESLEPSEETLEDCVQDYRENASGYEGIIDYVETQYPRHSQEFKDKVISYIKSKTESLTEDLSDDDTEIIKTINDVYEDRGEIESEDAINAIKVSLNDKGIEVDDDYLSDMIVKSVEMIDQLNESTSLKEDFILHPGRKFKTKSGHMLKITDVVTSLSEFDGHPLITIDYDYYTTDGQEGSSSCNAQDFYNMLQESVNVGDRVSHVDDQEPRQIGIVQDIKDGVAKVSFLYKGNEEVVDAPVDKLQREWTQVSNIGQHKVDAMDMIENEELDENITYTIGYDAGDNFSKTVKIQANSLGDAMKEFKDKNPDKKITSIFEEGLKEESKGNSFKDHHICQGCGNPLSKCTCKVEGLDED